MCRKAPTLKYPACPQPNPCGPFCVMRYTDTWVLFCTCTQRESLYLAHRLISTDDWPMVIGVLLGKGVRSQLLHPKALYFHLAIVCITCPLPIRILCCHNMHHTGPTLPKGTRKQMRKRQATLGCRASHRPCHRYVTKMCFQQKTSNSFRDGALCLWNHAKLHGMQWKNWRNIYNIGRIFHDIQ